MAILIPDRIDDRFWPKVAKATANECWLWLAAKNKGGYGVLGVGGHSTVTASRVCWELHYGEIPSGQCVLHKCDIRACVNPNHLFLGTKADNRHDCKEKGRMPIGESHGCSKLSECDVQNIRSIYASGGVSQRALGRFFNLSQGQIGQIVRREAWSHL